MATLQLPFLCLLLATATAQSMSPSPGDHTVSTRVAAHAPAPAALCPALFSNMSVLVVTCRKDDVHVACAEPMRGGTEVELRCQDGRNSSTWTVTCDGNGEWTNQQQTYQPLSEDCGSRDIREFTVDGETVTSEQPWLIVIYTRRSEFIGTLISTKHVVAGAYEVTDDKGKTRPASHLRLKAGKHLGDYYVTEANSQMRIVKSVHVHDEYDKDTFTHDIAVLVADQPFALTWDVNSACVDWNGLLQAPTPGQHVLTAGWRRGVNPRRLVYVPQPRVMDSHDQCRPSLSDLPGLTPLPSPLPSTDQLCARSTGNNSCDFEAGAGLLVERPTTRGARHFLVGVGRHWQADTWIGSCTTDRPTAFTSVLSHIRWLRRHIDTP